MIGRFLSGSTGTARLVELSTILRNKTKHPFESYEPWMCLPHDIRKHFKSERRRKDAQTQIVTTPDRLERLHSAFANEHGPFGKVGFDSINVRVAKPSEPFLERYHTTMSKALAIVRESNSLFHRRLDALVDEIIPLGPIDDTSTLRNDGSGLSIHGYRGGIFLSLPKNRDPTTEAAINIAHELGHQAFMVYQYADPILKSDYAAPVYSAIRGTSRPALMSFHALAALTSMCEFLSYYSNTNTALIPRKEQLQLRLLHGVIHFRSGPILSDLGQAMLEEFEQIANSR